MLVSRWPVLLGALIALLGSFIARSPVTAPPPLVVEKATTPKKPAAQSELGDPYTVNPTRIVMYEDAVRKLNELRELYETKPAVWSPELQKLAQEHANEMYSVSIRVEDYAFDVRSKGYEPAYECSAWGPNTAVGALSHWVTRPEHLAVLVQEGTPRFGLARTGFFWCLIISYKPGLP